MPTPLHVLQAQVLEQKTRIPSLYGDVDFSIVPERFAAKPEDRSLLPEKYARKHRARLLADEERVQRSLAYTMLGDTVADAYAALMPKYGFKRLIGMLSDACGKGLNAVQDPPQELVDFIQSMERVPDWVDMDLVNEGARYSRNQMANLTPFAIRGAFIATFMNKYSGLPMALTGALSSETSVQRVKETASFFTTATLPGALSRFGAGFKAAALVRLMHSMVRFNILKRSKKWDVNVYGIPIPQVDQMPAGTIPAFTMAFNLVRSGRKEFNKRERAVVELNRYQSYLLGLPEDLLPATPLEIVNTMTMYSATLRDGYDDATCGELVRSTMAGYLPTDKSLKSQMFDQLERSFSKVFFTRVFLAGYESSRATQMGVKPTLLDYVRFVAAGAIISPRLVAHRIAEDIPFARDIADKILIRQIDDLLVEYGHAEYTTDPSRYKEASSPASHVHPS
ncbi:MAG TPA: oxygenase MpaB family protein [Dongiaceae bacterium]|nr:oxygenase MpaB family protein [Dongiaceae bacterium]